MRPGSSHLARSSIPDTLTPPGKFHSNKKGMVDKSIVYIKKYFIKQALKYWQYKHKIHLHTMK